MAEADKQIIERIQDLIGSDVSTTTVPSLVDLVNSAFNYVADFIPSESEHWRHTNRLVEITETGQDLTLNNSYIASQYKVISVIYTDNSGIDRQAAEIGWDAYSRGLDSTSIFYNQKSFKNPTYTFNPRGKMFVSPSSGQEIQITYFLYFTTENFTTNTGLSDDENWFFPTSCLYAGILKSCLNILQHKISVAIQDEEDQELLSLLQAQSASLEKEFSSELQRLNIPYSMTGDPE